MKELPEIAGDLLGDLLALPIVEVTLRLGALCLAVLWLTSAWWAFRDLRARTRDSISPYLAATGVLFATPVGFPLALLVYHLVRPPTAIAEHAVAGLQRMLLEEDATRPRCPACAAPAGEDWVRCPACGSRLAEPCPACGRNAAFDWQICAWCAAELPWAAVPLALGDPDPGPGRGAAAATPRRAMMPVMAEPGPPRAARPAASLGDLARAAIDGLREAHETASRPPEPVHWDERAREAAAPARHDRT